MKISKPALLAFAAAMIFLQIGFGLPVEALYAQEPLFATPSVLPPAQDREAAVDPTVFRSRFVRLNSRAAALYGAQSKADGAGSDVMVLNLFDDVTLKAVMDQREFRSSTSFTSVGHIEGVPGSSVTFVMEDGVMAGNIRTPSAYYQLRYVAPDLHAVRQIDESRYPQEGDPIPVGSPQPDTAPTAPAAAADDGTRFDVMVVYTAAARAAARGTAAMNALINLAVAETNTAYARSGVIPRLRLVHTEEVAYDETDNFFTDLNRLTDPSDGFMDNVHALRSAHGADLVSLIVEGTTLCGLAWVMTDQSHGFEASAFSVTNRICATGNYSFGHELGHNMGLQHDRADTPEDGVFSYSHGYVDIAHGFRTIMGVQPDPPCCSRIQNFSNPNVTSGGFPTGVPGGSGESADAAASLNAVRLTVANWRTQADALAYNLTVSTTGPGRGTVKSNTAGISCGGDCAQDYKPGKRVVLTATAARGSVFRGWTGDCSGAGLCTLTMNGPKNATAIFALPLAVKPAVIPAGEVGLPYSASLVPAGGIPPHTVAVFSGALPAGLSLVGNDIVGTPTAAGERTFTIRVTDQLGGAVKRRYSLKIRKPRLN
jgi:hypothetical protein